MNETLKKPCMWIYFVSLLTLFGCDGQSSNRKLNSETNKITTIPSYITQATILTIDDEFFPDKKISFPFYYHDSLNYGTPFIINQKTTKLFLDRPTLICQANQYQTFYLIYPGENINLKIDNKEINFTINGDEKRNNELIFFKKLIYKYGRLYNFIPNKSYTSKVGSIELLKKADLEIAELKTLRINFLDSVSKTSSFSSNFYKLALNIIESAAFKDSLMLYWSNKQLLSKNNLYEKFVDEKIKTIKNIEFEPYPVYQNAILSLVSMKTTPHLFYELKDQQDFTDRFEQVCNNFDGIAKDFLLSHAIISAHNYNIKIPNHYIKKFEIECNNNFYKKKAIQEINDSKSNINVKDYDKLVPAEDKILTDIPTLISKYKGKVILFDFWASWCLPCREEFPAAKKLKSHFKDEEFVFLYISTDKKLENWMKCLQQEEMNPEENFVFLDAEKASFLKKYNIITVPRYIIIGKDGMIINKDAPRPSDQELYHLINNYLQK